MRWLVAIAMVGLLVIGYLYYDEFGLPTRVEEFLEDLTSDEEEEAAPSPTRAPARQAPTAAPTPRDTDPDAAACRLPQRALPPTRNAAPRHAHPYANHDPDSPTTNADAGADC